MFAEMACKSLLLPGMLSSGLGLGLEDSLERSWSCNPVGEPLVLPAPVDKTQRYSATYNTR